jgi:hypothetical protein
MPQDEADKDRKPYSVRLSAGEHDQIAKKAEAYGMGVSGYMRVCALDKPMPSKSRQKQINELRRLGGLFKHAFNEGLHEKAQIDPRAFLLLLAELRMAIHRTEAAPE